MSVLFMREVTTLKKQVLELGAMVEENLRRSVQSIHKQDAYLAQQAKDFDDTIDRKEVEVEEECLKILALHQPVASDLRYIVAIIKMNYDLERIGDQAASMATCAARLAEFGQRDIPKPFQDLAEKTQWMLKHALDALVNMDAETARRVWIDDDVVDDLSQAMYDEVKERIRESPDRLDGLLPLLAVSRYMERIGDHAANIAKDVLYTIEGEIVRHRGKLFKRPESARPQ